MSLYSSIRGQFAAVISYSGALLGEADFSGAESENLPPYLLLHGEADDVVPYQATERAYQFLLSIGATASMRTYAELGHSINEQGIIDGASFIKKHVALV